MRHVVLDEADEMLNMGFSEDVELILNRIIRFSSNGFPEGMMGTRTVTSQTRDGDHVANTKSAVSGSLGKSQQVLLFSATQPPWVENVSRKFLDNPVFVDSMQSQKSR